ncbi:MAG: arylsulfatase [Planctomycetaceae bacterium]|nr:arylsulfatase [Planctomycetaceae bacterium]
MFVSGFSHQADCAERPNIVVILCDDMGFSDIGCYGGEAETPNLDRLAAGGLRFTQFYNTGRCCPTRACLLTGLYPHQAGVGHMMEDKGLDGYRGELNRHSMTIAEVLRGSGYATFMAGKWHITKQTKPNGSKQNWPIQRGFDRFYGTIHGAGSFFDPNSLTRGNTQISPFADSEYQPEQYYYTDAISDHATRFIKEHQTSNRNQDPFFLYVAYTAAHWPMHALEKDIKKYRGRFDEGYESLRKKRLQRLVKSGLIDPAWEMATGVGSWKDVKNREWELRCMEVYAAMIDNMDQGIGRIIDSLEQSGELENTLILFMQDNGGCAEQLGRRSRNNLVNRSARPTLEPMLAQTLQRDMIPRQSRDGYPVLMGPGVMPGPADTYIAYGEKWANVSNTPFREYKHWVHEGGIATPLIAHWPATIKRAGRLEKQPSHLIDIMASCVDFAGADYPAEFAGEKIQPLEGLSLRPAFENKKLAREAIYWEHEGNRAVRVGDWKLVSKYKQPWELYDMKLDRTELHNLIDQKPELAKNLTDRWDQWAKRANVLPLRPKSQNKKK